MAKCKICKTNIPDGKEYCSNCQDKENLISNESYLDSLLNSVKDTAPTAESIYKKKKKSLSHKPNINSSSSGASDSLNDKDDDQDFSSYSLDLDDLEDFNQYSIDDDLFDVPKDVLIGDEELFGESLSDLLSDHEFKPKNQEFFETVPIDDENTTEYFKDYESVNKQTDEMKQSGDTFQTEYNEINDFIGNLNSQTQEDQDYDSMDTYTTTATAMEQATEENPEILREDNFNPEEIAQFEEDDNFDPDLNDLLNNLDNIDNSIYDNNISDHLSNDNANYNNTNYENTGYDNTGYDNTLDEGIEDYLLVKPEEAYNNTISEDDDILSLLNQISSDDPVAEDVKAINDLLSGNTSEPQKKTSMPSDVGEVFSDALKVVTALNDGQINEAELLNQNLESTGKKGKKNKKQKAPKKGISDQESEEKPKLSLFKRLFGNVKDEKTAKATKAEKELQGQEESDTTKKAAKKSKTPKGKKGTAAASEEDAQDLGKGKGQKGRDISDSNEETSIGKGKKDKKEKKEKKKKTKEVIQVIDEIEEDEGRINRLGALIVFTFFSLLALLVFLGTNVVSYTLSIQNATNYFDSRKYNEAYNEVYGIEFKDEDLELYDKIMTVMFVNKQLNSYNNYYSLGQYPKALDSLLKGLKRYDKYVQLATLLGIKTDLDYVREQILAELDNVFMLSEEEAMKINSYDDMSVYSMEVYDVVYENMNN